MENKREDFKGIIWKTKDNRWFAQSFGFETQWDWGDVDYVMTEEHSNLLEALKQDKLVEFIYTSNPRIWIEQELFLNGVEVEMKTKCDDVDKLKQIFEECDDMLKKLEDEIELKVEQETFGTCEMCESEGEWTYEYGGSKKKEILND